MKAGVIIPPKFLAVFSNREKMRRLSLSQPMSRSMMLRRRYSYLSNSTGRAERSSFAFDGMTGVILSSSRYSSIQSARYPLSPPRANGQAIRSPYSSTTHASTAMSKSSDTVDSCVCPAVKWKPRGRPCPSQRMWIFVENPTRERMTPQYPLIHSAQIHLKRWSEYWGPLHTNEAGIRNAYWAASRLSTATSASARKSRPWKCSTSSRTGGPQRSKYTGGLKQKMTGSMI